MRPPSGLATASFRGCCSFEAAAADFYVRSFTKEGKAGYRVTLASRRSSRGYCCCWHRRRCAGFRVRGEDGRTEGASDTYVMGRAESTVAATA